MRIRLLQFRAASPSSSFFGRLGNPTIAIVRIFAIDVATLCSAEGARPLYQGDDGAASCKTIAAMRAELQTPPAPPPPTQCSRGDSPPRDDVAGAGAPP